MRRTAWVVAISLAVAGVVAAGRPGLWVTPEQHADRLFRAGHFEDAAKAAADPLRQGAALYRAGDFKGAEAAFARTSSAEGAFDRGNALVMLGKYDAAVTSYDRALALRPGWADAADNRAIAVVRRDRLKFTGGDATGGKQKADDIVFEKGKAKADAGEVQVAGGKPLSDAELRGLWLKRVQTKPADFLRAKFAYERQEAK